MNALLAESQILFKDYSTLETLDICTHCCVDATNEALLRGSKRFQVPVRAVYEYNSSAKAGYTLENAKELKYFAPRILELVAKNEEIHHSTELYLCRFSLVPLAAWSPEEIDYFNRYASEYLNQLLHNSKKCCKEDFMEHLIMLGHLPIAIKALLHRILDAKDSSFLFLFATLYLEEVNWRKQSLTNSFAEDELSTPIVEFLSSATLLN